MLGMSCWQERGRLRLERIQVAGLGVLCVHVSRGRGEKRRLERAAKLLRRAGVRRVLQNREGQPELPGLAVVDGMPLFHAVADRLVLAALRGRGVQPRRATVVLRGEHPDGALSATARALCPQVHQIIVDTEFGGESLQRSLLSEFGAAVGAVGDRDKTLEVRFHGRDCGEPLLLCNPVRMDGLGVDVPQLMLPETLTRTGVFCALWQAGRLELSQVQITGMEWENKFT